MTVVPASNTPRRWGGMRATIVADHFVSSASNWIILVLAARNLDADDFAVFAGVQAGLLIVLGCVRGFFFEPILLRRSATDLEQARRTVVRVGVAALGCSAATAVVLAAAGQAEWAPAAALAGGLILQDGWRYRAFAGHDPRAALFLDVLWAAASTLTLLALATRSSFSEGEATLSWVVGAAVGGAVGLLLFRRRSAESPTGTWRPHRQRLAFALDFLMSSSLMLVSVMLVGMVAPATMVGSARLALSSVGVLGVVRRGDLTHLLASRTVEPTPAQMAQLAKSGAVRALIQATPICAAASLALWALHERLIGREDLDFVTIFGLGSLAVAIGMAANHLIAALRLMGHGWAATRRQALSAPFVVVLPLLGAWLTGAAGFGTGLLVAAAMIAALLWHAVDRLGTPVSRDDSPHTLIDEARQGGGIRSLP